MPTSSMQQRHSLEKPTCKIEIFKQSNFSLIEMMKQSGETISRQDHSSISTPRLTPLKMLERNRNQFVSNEDIHKLEDKIKELENSIFFAKQSGLDKSIVV
jgi:hypothetical protein